MIASDGVDSTAWLSRSHTLIAAPFEQNITCESDKM
jgi:hypothetical protein